MAGIPSNRFKTVVSVVSMTDAPIYTAPPGVTTIVLMAQVANIGADPQAVTFKHFQFSTSTYTEIVSNFPAPVNDSVLLLNGKLVLESGDRMIISGTSGTDIKFLASILETANQ